MAEINKEEILKLLNDPDDIMRVLCNTWLDTFKGWPKQNGAQARALSETAIKDYIMIKAITGYK